MALTSYAIDPKWGESLVGLRMVLLGKISKFDVTASPPFLLEVNDKLGNTYTIRYAAVLAYVQVDHPTVKYFRLPDMMPEDPAPDDTIVIWRCGHGQSWRGQKGHRV